MGWTGEGIRALRDIRKAQIEAKAREYQARQEPQPVWVLERHEKSQKRETANPQGPGSEEDMVTAPPVADDPSYTRGR
jgi:hypothetical protein